MNKKILIIDEQGQIPPQLENKFHEIIRIPNAEGLLKVTNSNASDEECVNKFRTGLTKYLDRIVGETFNNSGIKKFSFNRDIFITLLKSESLYIQQFMIQYNLTQDEFDSMINELNSYESVKAKYEREYKVNPHFECIRTEFANITKLIANFKKSRRPEFEDYCKQFLDKFEVISKFENKEYDVIKVQIEAVKNIIKVSQTTQSIYDKYKDLNPELTSKDLHKDVNNQKLADELWKLLSLHRSLLVLPKLTNIQANDYLVVGEMPAKVLNKFNNLGLRKTTFWYQLLNLKVNKLGTGANVVYIRTLSGAKNNIDKMAYFFNEKFAEALIPEMPKNKRIITDSIEAERTLNALICIPEGNQFGFDYETNGEEIYTSKFEMIGYSIANTNTAVYFDFRYIKLKEGQTAVDKCLKLTKAFLDKHASRDSKSKTWVYNINFELQVSYKLFSEFYEFWDVVVYQKIIGHHMEWWSLKYATQYYVRARSWDDNYDGIMDMIFPWLYKFNPSLGKKGDWEPRNDREYFIKCLTECNDERIKPYKESFIWLYDNGYNTKFTCIPAELIGGYGLLDSYYTVWDAKINQGHYDDRCELTFMDNLRMGARLTGIYRNEDIFNEYLTYSKKVFCYSVFHLARFSAYNHLQLKVKETPFNSIEEIQQFFRSISENDFTYWVLSHYIDYKSKQKLGRSILNFFRNDSYEGHINSNLLQHELGPELTERIMNVVLSVSDWYSDSKEVEVEEVSNQPTQDQDGNDSDGEDNLDNIIKTKEIVDGDIVKQLSNNIGDVLFPLVKYTKDERIDKTIQLLRLREQLTELEQCSAMNYTYEEFIKHDSFTIRMNNYPLDRFFELIFSYYKITSPGVFKSTYTECGLLYEKEYKVLACFDKYDPCGNYRPDLCEKYLPFKSWHDMVSKVDYIWNHDEGVDKVMLASDGTKRKMHVTVRNAVIAENLNPKKDNDFTQAKRYYYINDDDFNGDYHEICINDLYYRICNIKDIPYYQDGNSILLVCLGAIGKRFTKMISNYFAGVYSGAGKFQCKADDRLVSKTEGNVFRMYPHFNINSVTTKRWSSGYHTIYGHSTSKRVIVAPPGYLVSYFDISSAEVRSAAYMSGDPDLIAQFEAGKDPYIELARMKYGQDAPKSILKAHRKVYKTCLLGQLYGQSAAGMGVRIKATEAEAQEVVNQLRAAYPHLFKWIEHKQNYCVANRKIETFLGDDLEIFEFQIGRLKRVGINYCIQGNTAAILAHGFYNLIKNSDRLGLGITPFITVHDSSINYVPIKELPYLNEFYREHFTDYIFKETGIKYTFDTMIGADYTVDCVLGNDNKGGIELTGNDYALNDVINQIGRDNIITDEDWKFNTKLSDPLYDMMYNFEAASFGSCDAEQTIKFRLK